MGWRRGEGGTREIEGGSTSRGGGARGREMEGP